MSSRSTDDDTLAGHVRHGGRCCWAAPWSPAWNCRWPDGHSVHMLAYGLDRAEGWNWPAECAAIVAAWRSRALHMVDRLRELWVITWPQVEVLAEGGVVRPHIARAMAAACATARPDEAFTPQWIAAGDVRR